ncbi:MAG: 16S rRNA (uracil(1498)-N(3))-methyltransferase [bacterium]|nr:16S rRNA (uracil(1498)-N(3))-methyltransferase [bacterium]
MKKIKRVMSSRRFFTDPGQPGHPDVGGALLVTGDEYHHLKQVNRARPGDIIEVIDGRGSLFSGEIRVMKQNEAVVDIKAAQKEEKPPVRITIAPSLLKQRAMNILVEKLTEMGVDEIRPVIFSRTDEKFSGSRLKKWQKVAVQSLKVNKRLWCTEIHPPVDIRHFIRFIADAAPVKTKLLLDITGEPRDSGQWEFPAVGVIGPPGDMTGEEREELVNNGFKRYNINDSVLKSETAAISIAAILKSALNRRDTA